MNYLAQIEAAERRDAIQRALDTVTAAVIARLGESLNGDRIGDEDRQYCIDRLSAILGDPDCRANWRAAWAALRDHIDA